MNRLGTPTRRQFGLSGMLGYITVFSVVVAIPLCVVGYGCDLVFRVLVGLVCLIGLAAWVGYGLWCLFRRRKVIAIGVVSLVGLVIVAVLPVMLVAAEEIIFETHQVESFYRSIGVHQFLDDLVDSIIEMLGLE